MKYTPNVFDDAGSFQAVSMWVANGEGSVVRLYEGKPYYVDQYGFIFTSTEFPEGMPYPDGFVKTDVAQGKIRGWIKGARADVRSAIQRAKDKHKTRLEDTIVQVVPNSEVEGGYMVIPHTYIVLADVERTFEGMKRALKRTGYLGFIFVHEDGRTAKVKRSDVGLS